MKAGDSFYIPHEGERWTVVRSAIESGGGDFIADVEMEKNHGGPPRHVHDHEDERCEVLGGSVTFIMPGGPVLLKAGDRLHIPAGTLHTFKVGPDGVKLRASYTGRRMEDVVAQLAPGDKKGFFRMAQHLRRTNYIGSNIKGVGIRAFLAVLAVIGTLVGIRPRPV
jgi:quercetin dioxygenase-like cupin family protein